MDTASSEQIAWEKAEQELPYTRQPWYRTAWYQLSRNKLTLVGTIIAILFVLIGLFAPVIAPYDYAHQTLLDAYQPPLSPGHVLGTDQLGRDMLSRLVFGIRVSLMVGVGITIVSLVVGTVAGMFAGFYGGWVDTIISGIVEVAWGFPLILIAVILVGAIGPGLKGVVIAVGLVNWAGFARIVRGEVLSLREREFVQAARALGVSDIKIMLRHFLPNVMAPTLVMGSYYVALAIIVEAGLSFIGLGAQPPLPSLGTMIADGRDYLITDHWISTIPGITIVLIVTGMNLLGDGLRDIVDPRLREE